MAGQSTRGSTRTQKPKESPTEKLARAIRTDYRDDMNEALVELIQPFTPAVVKFKALTKPFDKGGKPTSFVATYIDARMVGERLNHVVGAAGWEDVYTVLSHDPRLGLPIECALTILGVTKRDVGQVAPGNVDEKVWKSAYSDALKRAAVKFGVGLYLYKIPQLTAEVVVGRDGKAKGLTIQAQKTLRATYQRWLDSDLNVFGPALDHGDPLPDLIDPAEFVDQGDRNVEGDAAVTAGAQPERQEETSGDSTERKPLAEGDRAATPEEIATLVELSQKAGADIAEKVQLAIGRHRAANADNVVSGNWLGAQTKRLLEKLNETPAEDVQEAFQAAA